MAQNVLITGANRGIGLELARQWHQRGDQVIAVCRQPSEELQGLGVRIIDGIDVTRGEEVQRMAEALGDERIDLLYNNAGILLDESLENMNFATMEQQFEVNTLGPLHVTHAVLGNMGEGAKIGLMTSRMGSIADNDSGGRYGYRMSKAALNAAGKSLSVDLKPRGIAVAILHPGYVRTEMTQGRGHITPDEAAERLVQRMDELNLENTGTFWHSDGSVLPW
ncbi:short-chain dehydrogenase [Thiohalorhabdus denitrificans]|uniref:Short-chain dehydrogenase n=1 Tax=Thiohalorhabdus denitrificans TaxID=381306 RepID=A0A0P9C952_9GAMM|nr:SDR family oxidoreductase [Thiohalorhabdus denitrificans]KPV41881.1 short-chain dehydrogenase [Thiohalorhabdus denitrificans]SCY65337.1 Short-chain dehydrogenase [Thiohalorhabdus denitrificans]